jgi:hypothetical protein
MIDKALKCDTSSSSPVYSHAPPERLHAFTRRRVRTIDTSRWPVRVAPNLRDAPARMDNPCSTGTTFATFSPSPVVAARSRQPACSGPASPRFTGGCSIWKCGLAASLRHALQAVTDSQRPGSVCFLMRNAPRMRSRRSNGNALRLTPISPGRSVSLAHPPWRIVWRPRTSSKPFTRYIPVSASSL